MKNLKKSLSLFTSLVVLCALIFSCKQEDANLPYEEANKTKFEEPIELSIATHQKSDGIVRGSITGVFDELKEEVTSYKLSPNILNALKITQSKFDLLLTQKLTQKSEDGDHKDCMEDCKDKYTNEDGTKIKGRGGCKFACWVDTIKEILIEIGDELIPVIL